MASRETLDQWADALATTPSRRRTDTAINRIHASPERIKENR